jgi:hypothetical protein
VNSSADTTNKRAALTGPKRKYKRPKRSMPTGSTRHSFSRKAASAYPRSKSTHQAHAKEHSDAGLCGRLTYGMQAGATVTADHTDTHMGQRRFPLQSQPRQLHAAKKGTKRQGISLGCVGDQHRQLNLSKTTPHSQARG